MKIDCEYEWLGGSVKLKYGGLMMDSKIAVELLTNYNSIRTVDSGGKIIRITTTETLSEIADFIEQQANQIESMKEILGDVLSDCYLSDGMRSEIEKRMEWDGGSNGS